MSVYIKGMKMPTSCRACMFSRTDIRNTDWCALTEKDLPCDCPLVPVPDHGDLVDRNALKKNAYPFPCAIGAEWAVTIRQINAAPTIIPAADKEEAE